MAVPVHTHSCAGCGVLVAVAEAVTAANWSERPCWCRACGGTADRPTPLATYTVSDGPSHYVVRVVEVLEGGPAVAWALEVPGQEAETFTAPAAALVAALEFTGWRDTVQAELTRQAAEADRVFHGIATTEAQPEPCDSCGHGDGDHRDGRCYGADGGCHCAIFAEPF